MNLQNLSRKRRRKLLRIWKRRTFVGFTESREKSLPWSINNMGHGWYSKKMEETINRNGIMYFSVLKQKHIRVSSVETRSALNPFIAWKDRVYLGLVHGPIIIEKNKIK